MPGQFRLRRWKQKRCKPGYVPRRWRGVGHLSTCLGIASAIKQPTPRQWTSSPCLPVYLALQLIGCAASGVAIGAGGLLPRLFTLTRSRSPGR